VSCATTSHLFGLPPHDTGRRNGKHFVFAQQRVIACLVWPSAPPCTAALPDVDVRRTASYGKWQLSNRKTVASRLRGVSGAIVLRFQQQLVKGVEVRGEIAEEAVRTAALRSWPQRLLYVLDGLGILRAP
jgi:hypothetical protein